MNFLEILTRHAGERADLMARMLARLEIDLEDLAGDTLGTRVRGIATGCLGCRRAATCALWLDGKLPGSFRDFCPNTSIFEIFDQ